jgi:hypothetical protein
VAGEIEIVVADVNDIEARVVARFRGEATVGDAPISLRGTVRGPFCDITRTLPAEFAFRDLGDGSQAEVVVPDPCTWSPELPHVYQVDVEAVEGELVMAEFHGAIGLRRAGIRAAEQQ